MNQPDRTMNSTRRYGRVVGVGLFVLPMLVLGLFQYAANRRAAPNEAQRIAATLASWGVELDGLAIPVSQEQVDRQVARLRSSISEERVQAADWLASRGLRAAGPQIAAAMVDPGTRRPCQLAKDLGSLGDPRWTDLLVQATRQRSDVDLSVCATLGLGQLQSPSSVSALIDVYVDDVAPTFALRALGRIADAASLPFLRTVAERPRNSFERKMAIQAIERVQVMQQPDAAAHLIGRIESSVAAGFVDQWAVRKLATLRAPQAVPSLREALAVTVHRDPEGKVALAAALLAHGQAGLRALRVLAGRTARPCATAAAALSLRPA